MFPIDARVCSMGMHGEWVPLPPSLPAPSFSPALACTPFSNAAMFSSTMMRLALCASGTLQSYSFIIAAMSRSRWRACLDRFRVRLALRQEAHQASKPGGVGIAQVRARCCRDAATDEIGGRTQDYQFRWWLSPVPINTRASCRWASVFLPSRPARPLAQ